MLCYKKVNKAKRLRVSQIFSPQYLSFVHILQSGEVLSAQLSHDLKLLSLVVESVRENGQQVDVLNISVSCPARVFP